MLGQNSTPEAPALLALSPLPCLSPLGFLWCGSCPCQLKLVPFPAQAPIHRLHRLAQPPLWLSSPRPASEAWATPEKGLSGGKRACSLPPRPSSPSPASLSQSLPVAPAPWRGAGAGRLLTQTSGRQTWSKSLTSCVSFNKTGTDM